jgi:hypothetical protein
VSGVREPGQAIEQTVGVLDEGAAQQREAGQRCDGDPTMTRT